MASQPGKIIFLKNDMLNVKIYLDLYACASYAVFMKILLGFNGLTAIVLQSTLL